MCMSVCVGVEWNVGRQHGIVDALCWHVRTVGSVCIQCRAAGQVHSVRCSTARRAWRDGTVSVVAATQPHRHQRSQSTSK